jgi:hypothetical protein
MLPINIGKLPAKPTDDVQRMLRSDLKMSILRIPS